MSTINKGFDPTEISRFRKDIEPKSYHLLDADEENDEFAHFRFIGKSDGREVIYDAMLYTLRLQHESELLELAEEKAVEEFPEYKKILEQQEGDESAMPEGLEERIGFFIADTIMEMEEEGDVKVMEHAEIDDAAEYGIGLDAGLNIPKVTPSVIEKFIRDFNAGTLTLDETLITFERGDENEDRLRFKE